MGLRGIVTKINKSQHTSIHPKPHGKMYWGERYSIKTSNKLIPPKTPYQWWSMVVTASCCKTDHMYKKSTPSPSEIFALNTGFRNYRRSLLWSVFTLQRTVIKRKNKVWSVIGEVIRRTKEHLFKFTSLFLCISLQKLTLNYKKLGSVNYYLIFFWSKGSSEVSLQGGAALNRKIKQLNCHYKFKSVLNSKEV